MVVLVCRGRDQAAAVSLSAHSGGRAARAPGGAGGVRGRGAADSFRPGLLLAQAGGASSRRDAARRLGRGDFNRMHGSRSALPVGAAFACAIAALTIVPRGLDADTLLRAQDDP